MADIAALVAQELLRLSEQLTVPTRFYFPSGTVPIDTAIIAFDAAWENTASAVRRKLVTDGRKRGTAAASVTVTGAAANPEQMLHAQYVSKPLRGQLLSGSISGQFRALESAAGANATIQIGIRVVSLDGQTVRATLLAVGGTTTTATTPPEFTTALTNRRLLTAGDATPLTLSPYTCVDGDRLVIEIGHNNKSTSVTQTHGISFGDNTVDLLTDDTTTTAQDPWVEFNSTIRFQDAVEQVRITDSGAIQRMDRGWVRIADGPVQAALLSGNDLAASVTAEALRAADILSVSREIEASLSDSLKVADGPVIATSAFLANVSESIRLIEQQGQSLNPEQAAPSESLKITDSVQPQMLLLVALQESLKVRDLNGGSVQLFGVLHITDTVEVAMVAGGGLSTSGSDEVLKITESLIISRDLTAAPGEALAISETLSVARGLTGTVTDAIDIADTTTTSLDPEQASPGESLRITDVLTATFGLELAIGDETLRLGDVVSGRLDPIEVTADAESIRVADTDLELARTLDVAVSDAIRISEVFTIQGALGAVAGPDALRLSDTVAAVLTPLKPGLIAEAIRITDSVQVLAQLGATIQPETIIISDRVVILSAVINETIRVIDVGQGRTSLLGVLHITDGPVIAQVGLFLSRTVNAESIRITDSVQALRTPLAIALTETVKVGYAFNQVEYTQDEFVRLAEVIFTDLATPATNLSTGLADEQVKISEILTARRTLERAVSAEAIRVIDTITASRGLDAVVSDAVRVADSVSAARDLTGTFAESLRISDSVSVSITPLQRAVVESVSVAATVAATIGNPANLSTGGTALVIVMQDAVTASLGMSAVVSEALRLTDTATLGFAQSLTVSVSESVHVSEGVAGGQLTPLLAPLDSEDITVAESHGVVLALALVVAPERAMLSESLLQLGMDISTDIPPLPSPGTLDILDAIGSVSLLLEAIGSVSERLEGYGR